MDVKSCKQFYKTRNKWKIFDVWFKFTIIPDREKKTLHNKWFMKFRIFVLKCEITYKQTKRLMKCFLNMLFISVIIRRNYSKLYIKVYNRRRI